MSRRNRSLSSLSLELDVPQPAGIRADLVGQHHAHHVAFIEAPELDLEVDQADADTEKEPGHEVVDAERQRHHVVDFLRRRPAESRDVFFRHHRIAEIVALVIELDDRARQRRAFLDAEALRQRACRDIAHHDLARDDLDFADQLLAHVDRTDEMRRYADVVQAREDEFRDPVVEDTLALNDGALLVVKGGGVVLEVLDERAGLRAFDTAPWPCLHKRVCA